MNARRAIALLGLTLTVLLGACSSAPERLATADIEPKVRVVSIAGEATEVTVVLFRGSLPFATYRLQADERLTATLPDGEPVELQRGVDESSWLRRNAYVATLPASRPGDEVVIALSRAGEASAPETLVRVPGEIRVTRPAAGDARTLNESFSVAWEGLASGDVELRFAVQTCQGLTDDEFEDVRTDAGFASSLRDGEVGLTTVTFSAPASAERCEADLLVGRVSDAIALDPAFGALRPNSRSVRVSEPVPLSFTEAPAVATADLEPKVRVVSTADDATEVTVVLFRAGLFGGTYELGVGERLIATPAGGEAVVLRPGMDLSTPAQPDAYVATLPALPAESDVVIALERVGEVSAPATVVRVPGEIVVRTPAARSRLTLGEPFDIEWEPLPDGEVELRFLLTSCVGLTDEEFEDLRTSAGYPRALRDGAAGSTTVTFSAAGAETCEATLLVGRVADGIDADPAYRGLRGASRAVRVSEPVPLVFEAAP